MEGASIDEDTASEGEEKPVVIWETSFMEGKRDKPESPDSKQSTDNGPAVRHL